MLEVKKAESPMLYKVKSDMILALAEGCAETAESDIPEAMLAHSSRAYLTTAFVLLACDWWKLKQQQEVVNVVLQSERGSQPGSGGGETGSEDSGDPEPDAGGSE